MNLVNYSVPNKIGWTEHDKLEKSIDGTYKVWAFDLDKPYEIGNGYRKYREYKYNYDVNGIFGTI